MDLGRPDRAARLEALAAEYALGTLPPRARRRLAAQAQDDARVATAIRIWEYRLAGLAEAVPAVTPSPRVWEGIRERLGLADARAADRKEPWWRGLALWRGLAVAGFALAAILGVLVASLGPRGETDAVVVVLAGPDARPALVATAGRASRTLLVKTVGAAPVDPSRTLELWALPQGANPQSLGVLPRGDLARVTLRAPADEALRNVPTLAVSLEPVGGSPTGQPTGPVLYTGPVQRFY